MFFHKITKTIHYESYINFFEVLQNYNSNRDVAYVINNNAMTLLYLLYNNVIQESEVRTYDVSDHSLEYKYDGMACNNCILTSAYLFLKYKIKTVFLYVKNGNLFNLDYNKYLLDILDKEYIIDITILNDDNIVNDKDQNFIIDDSSENSEDEKTYSHAVTIYVKDNIFYLFDSNGKFSESCIIDFLNFEGLLYCDLNNNNYYINKTGHCSLYCSLLIEYIKNSNIYNINILDLANVNIDDYLIHILSNINFMKNNRRRSERLLLRSHKRPTFLHPFFAYQ